MLTWRRKILTQLKYAILCAKGLGDGLIFMVLAHNLTLSGQAVTLFSTPLYNLRQWFPSVTILPYPGQDTLLSALAPYTSIIAFDHAAFQKHHVDKRWLILREQEFNKTQSMVENLKNISARLTDLPAAAYNGICPPACLSWRLHAQRVVLHPTSTHEKRAWPIKKFLSLASLLEKKGYSPIFCVSGTEYPEWVSKIPSHMMPCFDTLNAMAGYIYESGSLIGNDSGLGHLASCLQLPTLSLFARKSYSRLWRPGWGTGNVVTPPAFLIGGRLKQKYWKQLLSPKRVLCHFLHRTVRQGDA